MHTSLTRASALLLAGAVLVLAGCGDSVASPAVQGASRLTLNYSDGGQYEASGTPTVEAGDIAGGTFAVAFRDSLGGLVITSFQQQNGTQGDLFVLQLTESRTGSFGPCGPSQDCHGRMLGDFSALTRQANGGAYWEIVSGTVQVDEVGPDRLKGSVSDLLMQAQDSIRPDRTIQSGSFDLQLLSDQKGKVALARLLCDAAQPLAGVGCPQAVGDQLSFTYADGEEYNTYGEPTIVGDSLALAGFATAFPDTVGGLVISSLEMTEASRGDLFVLRLAELRSGSFGPCGVGHGCAGQLLQGVDSDPLRPFGNIWSIVGGSVQVDTVGPDYLKGSFTDLVLQAQDTIRPNRTIKSGTFEVTPIPEGDAAAAMRCFLARVNGANGC